MNTITTIAGKAFELILKSKPAFGGPKMVAWVEFRIPFYFSWEAPVISLNNKEVPYGIPDDKDVKFTDKDGQWHGVGTRKDADGKVLVHHKYLVTAEGRYTINKVISNYIRKNPTQFGLAQPAPKVDLAKVETTNIPVPAKKVKRAVKKQQPELGI